MIGNFLNNLKKDEIEEENITHEIPDLMGDPVTNNSVDLMASGKPDLMGSDSSVNQIDLMAADLTVDDNIPVQVSKEKKPEIVEQPGLERQLETPSVSPSETPIVVGVEQIVQPQTTQTMDAFSMSVPVPEAMPTTNNSDSIETLDLLEEKLERTQKICTCGTPNDPLAKFCVSCGKTYE